MGPIITAAPAPGPDRSCDLSTMRAWSSARGRRASFSSSSRALSCLVTAAFVTDERGELVYFNEAAEELLGRPFAETAALAADEWGSVLLSRASTATLSRSRRCPPGSRCSSVAPAHSELCITAATACATASR